MYTKRVGLLIIIMIISATYSCNPSNVATPTLSKTSAIYQTEITSSPLKTTVSPNKKTPTPTITSKYLPSPTDTQISYSPISQHETIDYQCLQIEKRLPDDSDSNGVLVTRKPGLAGVGDTNLINLKTQSIMTLPASDTHTFLDYAVSPNHQWLAYTDYDSRDQYTSRLVIATSNGKEKQVVPWQKEWYTIVGWLDNERLLISKRPSEKTFGDMIVLNPFTLDKKELIPNFPNITQPATTNLNWGNYSFSGIIPNSSLTRILYPRTETDFSEIALWDLINNQEIIAIPNVLSFSPEPQWSPDNRFIAVAKYELYGPVKGNLFLIGSEGSIEQLTDFSSYTQVSIGSLRWSPDGKYLAFWLYAKPSHYSDYRLAVLDVANKKIVNYCIPGSVNGLPSSPIWSPDSKELVVENFLGNNHRMVILVDIARSLAAQVAEDIIPFGWMTEQ